MANMWADVARGLDRDRLEWLKREDLPADYHFTSQATVLEDIARDASAAAYMSEAGLWDGLGIGQPNADGQAAALDALLTELDRFKVSADANVNPNQERQSIVNGLLEHRNWLAKNARPYGVHDAGAIEQELQRIQAVRVETEHLKEEALNALESIRIRAAETGAVSAATLYTERAAEEDKAAGWASKGVAAAMAGFVVSALALFEWWAPDPDAKTGAAISAVAGRALVLATIAYGITFFAKNFRAHRHLAAVNRFKANALEATPLLREGIATDDQRDVIVGELVRAVFAVPETGFVDANGESVTIQTPVHALVSGMGGARSTSN